MSALRFCIVVNVVVAAAVVNDTRAKEERPQPAGPTASTKAADKSAGREAKLTKGMSAKDVRAVMGQPKEIRPMEAPSGKAEIWIYRDWASESLEQVQIGSKPIVVTTITEGRSVTQKVGEDPIFKTQRKTRYRVISLLMFDDRYVVCKIGQEEERAFE